tara:strand:- start:285 stop:782 length:498 start_codon:yes stop_codon:yes gene_type:complete
VTKKGSPNKQETDDYTRLTNLNSLVSFLGGNNSCVESEQLNVALAFLRSNNPDPEMPSRSFEHCVSQVVRFHDPGQIYFDFAHWDARRGEVDPLWLYTTVLEKLSGLGNQPSILLIVSGLRKALLQKGRRWTRCREKTYRESIRTIELLASRQANPKQKLSVLFI